MIVSKTLKRVTSRWLQACVLLCATVVLPCGMVCAQEHKGIKPVPAEVARGIGKALLEAALMNFAGNPSQAVGVFAEDDYRLYGIGRNASEPLIDGRFGDGEGPGQAPLAIEVKDIDEESETAAVVITVFNKYQAALRAGVAE